MIVLLSGGGSRLLSAPCPPITIEEQNVVTRLLHRHGGTVADVNAMRRHTSLLKGGRLAQLASPAKVIGLIISDTPGDALELVGSGPTAPDPTTPRHCLDLIKGKRGYDIGAEGLKDEFEVTPTRSYVSRTTLKFSCEATVAKRPRSF